MADDDYYDDEDLDTDDDSDAAPDNSPAQLRKAANRAKKIQAERDQAAADRDRLAKELAFLKADVDVNKPLAKTLMASYTGELSEAQVRAYIEAQEAQAVFKSQGQSQGQANQPNPNQAPSTTPTTPATPPISDAELHATAERDALTSGATAPDAADPRDPREVGLERAYAAMEAGASMKDASGALFAEIFDAAVRGDQRVLHTPTVPADTN